MNGLLIYILCGVIFNLFSNKVLNFCYDKIYALYITEKLKEKPDYIITKIDFFKFNLLIIFILIWRVLIFPVPLTIKMYYILKDLINNGKKR